MRPRFVNELLSLRLQDNLSHGLRALALSAALLALPASTWSQAQVITDISKSARWDKAYSAGSRASGNVHLDANARFLLLRSYLTDLGRAEAAGTAHGYISILGRATEGARVEARGSVQNHQFTLTPLRDGTYRVDNFARGGVYAVSGLVRIGGRDIYRPQLGGQIPGFTWAFLDRSVTLNILNFGYNFNVGPVPCGLNVRVGAGGTLRAPFAVNPSGPTLSVSDSLRVYTHATFSFTVDIIVASAGVTAEGRFANIRGSSGITVSPSGVYGNLSIVLDAIRLICTAWVRVGWGWFSTTYTTTLFDGALEAISTSRPLL